MRLAIKLLSILFLSTSILFFVLIYLNIDTQRKDLTEAFIDRAKATSFIFTSSITDVTNLTNPDFLRQSINYAMWGDAEILAIHVYGISNNGLRLVVSSDPLRDSLPPETFNTVAYSEGTTLSQITNDGDVLSIYQPISISGKIHGTVQIDSTLERVNTKITTSIYTLIAQYAVLITIFLLFLYLWLRKLIFTPLALFDKAITEVKHQNLDYVIRVSSKDEFGKLSVLFNEMLQDLKSAHTSLIEHTKKIEAEVATRTREIAKEKDRLEDTVTKRTAELQKLKDNLEIAVNKRTEELEKTVAILERTNNFMVDREVAMVELKKKLTDCGGSKTSTTT
jgi:methyl-accepting chemotaxis protein